jgi:hypothetical protein
MEYLNPFCMSKGDLILGGAAEGLEPQWVEFEKFMSKLRVPFFLHRGIMIFQISIGGNL